jgi:hypothetical protein
MALRWLLTTAATVFLVAAAEDKTLYKLANGECGEATLDERVTQLVTELRLMTQGSCKDVGYSEPEGHQDITLGGVKISLALYKKTQVLDLAKMFDFGSMLLGVKQDVVTKHDENVPEPGTTIFYKVFDANVGQCGQVAMNKSAFKLAKALGLQEGTCGDHGFTLSQGTKEVDAPILGKIVFALYKKSGALGVADVVSFITSGDMVTLHKVFGPICSEVTVEKKYATDVAKLQGMSEGSCTSEGYIINTGKQDLNLPLIGEVDITLYGKPLSQVVV